MVTDKDIQCFFISSAKGNHVTSVVILDAAFIKTVNFYG